MSEKSTDDAVPEGIDPNDTPFALPGTAGLPFRKGSDEDRAIEQVIREAEAERAARSEANE